MKSEIELAKELGLTREHLRECRMLNGITETKKVSNRIMYTEEGEHKIRNIIQNELLVEDIGEPEPVGDVQELTVTHIPVINRQIIFCGDIRVRLRNNKNFLKGMKLKARPPVGSETSWVLIGRCPRYRGRY